MDSGETKKTSKTNDEQGFLPLDFEARQQLDANEPPVPQMDLPLNEAQEKKEESSSEPKSDAGMLENLSVSTLQEKHVEEDTEATQKDFHVSHDEDELDDEPSVSPLNNKDVPPSASHGDETVEDLSVDASKESETEKRKEPKKAPVQTSSPAPVEKQEESGDAEKKTRKKHFDAHKLGSNASIGRLLHEARVNCDLSVAEVEAETRIKSSYIEALEHDDFKELPPAVYVKAYIRSLCELYDLSSDIREDIQHGIKQGMEGIVSEEIIQHLEKDKQVNVEDEQKIKRLFYIVLSGAATVLILIIASICFMIFGGKDSTPPPVPPTETANVQQQPVANNGVKGIDDFDPAKLDDLTLPVQLDMTKLQKPKNTAPAN